MGTPKTASTYIQHLIASEDNFSLSQYILSPRSGSLNGCHHNIFLPFLADSDFSYLLSPVSFVPFCSLGIYDQIFDEINRSDVEKIFLSSELLWNPLAFNTRILVLIKSFFSDYNIIILVCLRDIVDQAMSGYKQRIVGPQRYSGSIDNHLLSGIKLGIWNYSDRLRQLANIFYPFKVRVIAYNESPQTFAYDFLSSLDLQELELKLHAFNTENVSRRHSEVKRQHVLNQYHEGAQHLFARAAMHHFNPLSAIIANLNWEKQTSASVVQILRALKYYQEQELRYLRLDCSNIEFFGRNQILNDSSISIKFDNQK